MIDWNAIAAILDALAWPSAFLVAVLVTKPQRLIERILEHGGVISGGGFAVELKSRTDNVSASIGEDLVDSKEEDIQINEPEPLRPEYQFQSYMNAWNKLVRIMWDTLTPQMKRNISLKQPREIIYRLLNNGKIELDAADQIEELLDIRNLVRRHGPGRLAALDMGTDSPVRYAASVDALIEKHFS